MPVDKQEDNDSVIAHEQTISVRFEKSSKTITWDDSYDSLLEFAEGHGIDIDSGCRFGDCGTCLTKIIEGSVKYIHPTMVDPGNNYCLPCSCVPQCSLILNA